MTEAIWHGTQQEETDLNEVISRNSGSNCECSTLMGLRSTCAVHKMAQDQGTLDHLLFYRRIAKKLKLGEFRTEVEPPESISAPNHNEI